MKESDAVEFSHVLVAVHFWGATLLLELEMSPFFVLNSFLLHVRYLSKQHLIDVTEVFKVVNAEKKVRIVKLGFYVLFFGLVITRFSEDVLPLNSLFNEERMQFLLSDSR